MKRLAVALAAIVALVLPSAAPAAVWNIDPAHTNVAFKIRHLTIANVKGTFAKFSGTVDIDDQDITKSRIDVTIDTASIGTNVQKRDDHLRSADFFDVATYPTMTFVSRKIVSAGQDKLTVTGELTLRGVTREVVLDVEGLSPEVKDPWGGVRRGASASARINRKDFGVSWNEVLEGGGLAVGEDVAISLEVELVKDQKK
jgi:polyisoprenoid-binding protein YceI